MIIGIGTDLVDCQRIAGVYQRFGQRFAEKILAPSEQILFNAASSPVGFLAKRFAAKEAAAKALGVGLGASAGWREIIITRDQNGAPGMEFQGEAAKTANRLGVKTAHVSLSDERSFALAFVVLNS